MGMTFEEIRGEVERFNEAQSEGGKEPHVQAAVCLTWAPRHDPFRLETRPFVVMVTRGGWQGMVVDPGGNGLDLDELRKALRAARERMVVL